MARRADRWSTLLAWFMLGTMVVGLVLYNLSPLYLNYRAGMLSRSARQGDNVECHFSIYYLFPGFDPNDHFILATIVNFTFSWTCANSVCGIDLLLYFMVFQIVARLKLLDSSLRMMSQSDIKDTSCTGHMFTEEENRSIRMQLKQCIDDHREIVQFATDMSTFFGPILAQNYLFHLTCCCILLLECSTSELTTLIRFGPLTTIMFFQLILISIVFEVVDTESEKLSESVYGTPWELMDRSNRMTVCILLRRVQTTIQVTALGLTPVGVKTMAGILKATFSYYTFLRSV